METIDSKNSSLAKKIFSQEEVELIIIGLPKNWDESDTHGTPLVEAAIKKIQKEFPTIPLKTVDERYTSKMAKDACWKWDEEKRPACKENGGLRLPYFAGIFKYIVDFRLP